MEPETPLLNVNQLKQNMEVPPVSNEELFKNILSKGVDYELLNNLEIFPIEPSILEGLKKLSPDLRIESLEQLVLRLLVRMKRIELENEHRFLENINIQLKLQKLLKLQPAIEKIYKHFFEDPLNEPANNE